MIIEQYKCDKIGKNYNIDLYMSRHRLRYLTYNIKRNTIDIIFYFKKQLYIQNHLDISRHHNKTIQKGG